MSATADQELAELRRANAELLRERDAALTALALRNSEYGERIEQQAATIDALNVMSTSPGDAHPVFRLIVERARAFCQADIASLALLDGDMLHLQAHAGVTDILARSYEARFPLPVNAETMFGRAILACGVVQTPDVSVDQDHHTQQKNVEAVARAFIAVPLLRAGVPIGAIIIGRGSPGEFSAIQIELLQTFAEQAVIAITSAETYRALQTRTADLQESLEYQTATSDVLKVISRSTFDLHPVLATVIETAARLCNADMAMMFHRDEVGFRMAVNYGYPPELEGYWREKGSFPIDLKTPAAGHRAARERRPVHVHDVTAVPDYPKELHQLGGQRTSLSVPLLRDGETIGVIGLGRRRVDPFTDRQIELICTFADQAVIAIENTRLVTEQREALEQQTATAEVLQVINASPGNLAPVFDAMLEKAMRLCGAAFGLMSVYDGGRFHRAAERGVPKAFTEFHQRNVGSGTIYGPGTAPALLVDGAELVQNSDLMAEEVYHQGEPNRRALVDLGGARSHVSVALRKDQMLLGYLAIYRQEVKPFAAKEVALLQNFAAQAVIAMENARLLTEQREALEQQTATAEVLRVINASPGDLTPVFDAILEKAHQLCGVTIGALEIWDGEHVRALATRGMPPDFDRMLREGYRPPADHSHWALVNGGRFVHVPNPGPVRDPTRSFAGAGTFLAVALRKDKTLLGRIVAVREEVRPFSDKEIALLEGFGAQAVIAMENARLLAEIHQRQEELRITFENMGDGVAMFNETQHLVAWNGKFQEVYDLPDTLLKQHRTYEEYLRFLAARGDFGAGVDTVEQIDELVASTGQPYGYERTRPDGRVIEIRRNPVPDGGFVLIFSDITERKRSEEEIRAARDAAEAAYRELKAAQASLIQAEKMASLGQLTAGIAHEIKNPLNFVNNFASLSVDLLDELKQTAAPGLAVLEEASRVEFDELANTLASNLDKINEHGRRADGIVRGMLEHSRGSSGERRLVELNALVDEALNLAYHGARAQDQSFAVTLQRELGEGIAPIILAPQDVTRVLLNLFSNGFYAARERQRTEATPGFEPTFKVSTCDLNGAVEIRVRDNGIGIPPEIMDRLFQPFFTTKPPGEGTGLGLSMSYDIITQQHGGSISVDSKVGEYSEFTVWLPRGS